MREPRKQVWIACLHWSVIGCVVPYIRRHGQKLNRDGATWPAEVRQFLLLDDPKRPHYSSLPREVFDELTPGDNLDAARDNQVIRVTVQASISKIVTFYLKPEPKPAKRRLRGKHVIRHVADLLLYFGAGTPHELNRRIYKDTDCGASISVQGIDGKWYHNGQDWSGLEDIQAFTIQTIVEGSEATVDSDHFVLPVKESEVKAWIDEMESEADRLWHEANDNEEEEG